MDQGKCCHLQPTEMRFNVVRSQRAQFEVNASDEEKPFTMAAQKISEKLATTKITVTPALNTISHSNSECPTLPMDATRNAVLFNTFVIRKKQYNVSFGGGKLTWESVKTNGVCVAILVEHLLAVQPQVSNAIVPDKRVGVTLPDDQTPANHKQFTICYAKRMESSSNPNKWRHFSLTFQNGDSQVCQLWIERLQQQIDEQVARPRRLLLFVNPYGGKKQALRIYDSTVKPILQLAGIDASVVISQRSNQIRDFVMTQSLEHFDGIVCIGGDGTFSELFNGIIFRSFQDSGWTDFNNLEELPKIIAKPLGIIPAGSTDTVAYCLNGTCDIRTIVLNIVLGQVNGMDLSSVSNQNGLVKFYASVMSYGFLGDVAVESEKYRWMGPKRYDYSGFKKLLRNRGYDGEISLLVDPSRSHDPLKGPACLERCPICTPANEPIKLQTNQPAVITNTNTQNFSDKCVNNNEQNVRNDSHLADNQMASNIHIDIHVEYLKNAVEDNDNGHFVKTINGKFFMVNGANISCACPRSPNGFSKYCHLCDGYIDLILVRHTSFFNSIRFLLAMSSRNCKITDLNHVEIYRTRRFSFKSNGIQPGASAFNLHSSCVPIDMTTNESNHSSSWNCEGEVVHDSDVSIRSHRHLINVYRRELFNAQNGVIDESSEANCCC